MEAVKILTEPSFQKSYSFKIGGEKIKIAKWCLGITEAATSRAFCSGLAYGIGDSDSHFETKSLSVQNITCRDCIEKINKIKKVKTSLIK